MQKYNIDKDYIIQIRRQIHAYPEIGFDLPRTIALVKAELEKMEIPYTEEYGKSSIVGFINPKEKSYTIGLRADMDALRIDETNQIPFKSKIDGQMHACGHDAHTAMLLGAAKALKEIEEQLTCRVILLFQPAEEIESGAMEMVAHGIMKELDLIVGLHVDGNIECGKMGICKGPAMASSRNFHIEFFGKTAHASCPHSGQDALAACATAYVNLQAALTRSMNPLTEYVCSVGKMAAGTMRNVVADYAEMEGTIRTFDMDVDQKIIETVEMVMEQAAQTFGCTSKVTSEVRSLVLFNDYELSDGIINVMQKIVGEENIVLLSKKLGSEDFSRYLAEKPGVFARIGTRNEEKGIRTLPHNNDFMIDEDALDKGSTVFVQFVLDFMRE